MLYLPPTKCPVIALNISLQENSIVKSRINITLEIKFCLKNEILDNPNFVYLS